MIEIKRDKIQVAIESYKNTLDFIDEIKEDLKIIKNSTTIGENYEEIYLIYESLRCCEVEEKYKYQKLLSPAEIYEQLYYVYACECLGMFFKTLNSYSEYTNQVFNESSDYFVNEKQKVIDQLEKVDLKALNHIFNISCTLKRDYLNDNLCMIYKYLKI